MSDELHERELDMSSDYIIKEVDFENRFKTLQLD